MPENILKATTSVGKGRTRFSAGVKNDVDNNNGSSRNNKRTTIQLTFRSHRLSSCHSLKDFLPRRPPFFPNSDPDEEDALLPLTLPPAAAGSEAAIEGGNSASKSFGCDQNNAVDGNAEICHS